MSSQSSLLCDLRAYHCPVERVPEYWPELVIPVSEKAPVPISTSAKNRKGAARFGLYDEGIRSVTRSQDLEAAESWRTLYSQADARRRLLLGGLAGLSP